MAPSRADETRAAPQDLRYYMKILVNGEAREVEPGFTVRQLVELVTPKGAAAAAEVNKELIPRRAQESTLLKEGDVVEVVTLVGGG